MILLLMILALPLNLVASYTVANYHLLILLWHQSPQLPPTTANQLSLLVSVMVNVLHLAKYVTSTWIVLMALMRGPAVSMMLLIVKIKGVMHCLIWQGGQYVFFCGLWLTSKKVSSLAVLFEV